MSSEQVTTLTSAFNVTGFVNSFAALAPFIVTVVGTLIGVGLLKWGVRTVRKKLSGGM